MVGYRARVIRRWAVLAILTYRKYVAVAALRPPRLTLVRYARHAVANTFSLSIRNYV
jgi:hypothetical protein